MKEHKILLQKHIEEEIKQILNDFSIEEEIFRDEDYIETEPEEPKDLFEIFKENL